MPGFEIVHPTSKAKRRAERIISAMIYEDLPRCRSGGERAARETIRQVLYRVGQAEKEWRNKRCYHAMAQLTVAYDRMRDVGCYTAGLPKEKQRRLAKRWKHATNRVTKMHWKMMGSCLRDKPVWTGNEVVYAAAGRPTLPLAGAAPDMRRLVRLAKDQGWRVTRTRRNHYRFCPPRTDSDCVVTSGTPGSQRSIRQAVARLRRSGLEI
ncbi:MAG: hypothetical protein JSV86_10590 [Gemmatimonadota bacterium]|nr:MAG: hypothetical protein JSV86_10590 [Gemmatimonadota bacterium]